MVANCRPRFALCMMFCMCTSVFILARVPKRMDARDRWMIQHASLHALRAWICATSVAVILISLELSEILVPYFHSPLSRKQIILTSFVLCLCTHNAAVSMQVDGSRYWGQRLDATQHASALSALCDRAALFVKKRARALAYSDDPTGVRSLLSTLFDPNAASSDNGAAGAIQTSTNAAASGAACGSAGHNLMQMCWTFSADPMVTAFALACTAAAVPGRGGSPPSAARSSRVRRLQRDMGSLLSECMMHEQAQLLPMRLQLYHTFKVRSPT